MRKYLHDWLAFALVLFTTAATAAPLPTDPLERSCWLRYSRERTRVNLREPTAVDFANLGRQVRLRSPFQVDFAVRGMGVVPAGKVLKGTGHHHILIDTPLPLDVQAPIPFSATHKHFGKGQTGTQLDLPPGRHTLRLLFADHEHRPYFVYSPEIEVTVLGPRNATPLPLQRQNVEASCEAWYQDELARPRPPTEPLTILNLRDGESVVSPFNLRFGVDGWGVCASEQSAERTGHFLLEVRKAEQLLRSVNLSHGATQANLTLPDGAYQLRLRFVDARAQRDLLPPYDSSVQVVGQDRL